MRCVVPGNLLLRCCRFDLLDLPAELRRKSFSVQSLRSKRGIAWHTVAWPGQVPLCSFDAVGAADLRGRSRDPAWTCTGTDCADGPFRTIRNLLQRLVCFRSWPRHSAEHVLWPWPAATWHRESIKSSPPACTQRLQVFCLPLHESFGLLFQNSQSRRQRIKL